MLIFNRRTITQKRITMTKRIHIYQPNGAYLARDVKGCPPLKELQGLVGGLIERTEVLFKGQTCDMIVNEEGLLKRLPFNPYATHVRMQYLTLNGMERYGSPIVGSAVIFEGFKLE